jgi:hypothetical protein
MDPGIDPMSDTSHCPHIDRGDHRCSHRFTLSSAEQVYAVCCGGQHGCQTFHRLNMELAYGTLDAPKAPVRRLTMPAATPLTVSADARNKAVRNLGA